MTNSLSAALEDYLEVILHLSAEGNGAKISDIARQLNIAKPSVTQAINILEQKGFVTHHRYGPVLLTEKGFNKARAVWHKHETLRDFLRNILGVSPVNAHKDACLIEHSISQESMDKLEAFMHWYQFEVPIKFEFDSNQPISLSNLEPGDRATILKVTAADSRLRRRLFDMGVVAGTDITMERLAPLGDPVEIEINGFHLSLRKNEAASVLVKYSETK